MKINISFENGESLENNIEEGVARAATSIGKFLKGTADVSAATYRGTKKGLAKSFNITTDDSLKAEIAELRELLQELKSK